MIGNLAVVQHIIADRNFLNLYAESCPIEEGTVTEHLTGFGPRRQSPLAQPT